MKLWINRDSLEQHYETTGEPSQRHTVFQWHIAGLLLNTEMLLAMLETWQTFHSSK